MKTKNVIMLILSIVVITVSYSILCTCKNYNTVKYGEKDVELYEKLIDKLVKENENELNSAEYIAVDADSFNIVSGKDKTRLITFLGKYNKSVLLASYSMLSNDTFMEDNELKGTLISVSDIKREANRINGNIYFYESSLSASGFSFKAVYKYNRWNIKYTSKQIS